MLSIAEDIVQHVEYTMARSRYRFDDFEAYQATSLSLRDRLVELWNDTQTYFKCVHARSRIRTPSHMQEACMRAHTHNTRAYGIHSALAQG